MPMGWTAGRPAQRLPGGEKSPCDAERACGRRAAWLVRDYRGDTLDLRDGHRQARTRLSYRSSRKQNESSFQSACGGRRHPVQVPYDAKDQGEYVTRTFASRLGTLIPRHVYVEMKLDARHFSQQHVG